MTEKARRAHRRPTMAYPQRHHCTPPFAASSSLNIGPFPKGLLLRAGGSPLPLARLFLSTPFRVARRGALQAGRGVRPSPPPGQLLFCDQQEHA